MQSLMTTFRSELEAKVITYQAQQQMHYLQRMHYMRAWAFAFPNAQHPG